MGWNVAYALCGVFGVYMADNLRRRRAYRAACLRRVAL